MKYQTSITTTLALLLGAIFIYAGIKMMIDPAAFAKTIASFRLLPVVAINPLALGLPFLEILGAVLLVVPRTRSIGACLIGGLCAVFLLGLVQAKRLGITASYGCFGSGRESIGGAIFRDVAFLAITAWVWLQSSGAYLKIPSIEAMTPLGGHPKN